MLFDGYDVHQNIELLRSRIGFVPQDDVVHRKLSVDAALEYAAKLRLPGSTKAERAEIIDNVLNELELTSRRKNPLTDCPAANASACPPLSSYSPNPNC